MKRPLLQLAVVAVFLLAAAPAHAAQWFAASDQKACEAGNANEFLEGHHANVLRVVVPPYRVGQFLPCIEAAHDVGYRVYLSLIFWNDQTPAQAAQFFADSLPQYAPYLWAVSVGNEQELGGDKHRQLGGMGQVCSTVASTRRVAVAHIARFRVVVVRRRVRRGHHFKWIRVRRRVALAVSGGPVFRTVPVTAQVCRPTTPGEDYRTYWDAIEPVLARVVPNAVRVYGEAGPWAAQFVKDGFQTKPSGVQAVSFHCYETRQAGSGLSAVPALAAWAQSEGLPLWCSEMAPALFDHHDSWTVQNTEESWARKLAFIGGVPGLDMLSFYRWDSL